MIRVGSDEPEIKTLFSLYQAALIDQLCVVVVVTLSLSLCPSPTVESEVFPVM